MIRIRSGEYCDCICLEIEKVPDISILLDETNTNADIEQYIRRNKKGFEMLLSELYQITKGQFSDDLLWMVYATCKYIDFTGDKSILDILANEGKLKHINYSDYSNGYITGWDLKIIKRVDK